jgi:hypothetical protein
MTNMPTQQRQRRQAQGAANFARAVRTLALALVALMPITSWADSAPDGVEFIYRDLTTNTGALDRKLRQAKVFVEVPDTNLRFQARLASQDPEIARFKGSNQQRFTDLERNQMRDVRLNGALGAIAFGLRDYAVDDSFKALAEDKQHLSIGRGGTEFWASLAAGPFTVKPQMRQTYDNVHLNPKRPRMIKNELGVGIGQVIHDWPTVGYTLSYFTGDRSSAYEPAGTRSQSASLLTYDGSLYFLSEKFDASVYVQQQRISDRDASGSADGITNYYYASTTFRPTAETGITAMAGISDENYTGYGARAFGRDFSFDVYFTPADSRVSYTAYAGYRDYENGEWYQDYGYGYVGGDVKWVINRLGREETSLSLGLSHYQYTDRLYSEANESDVPVWLTFRYDFDVGGRRVGSL